MDDARDVGVLIAGGGPNGLMLAGELALNGVRPVVLERSAARDRPTRANGLIGRVAHVFDRRGLLTRCGMRDGPPPAAPFFQFGGLPLDLRDLTGNPMTVVPVTQPRVEEVLEERARELGADIRRGHELTGFTDAGDADGRVDCAVRGPDGTYRVRARYLIGADGSRSAVRKAAGIGFPGGGRDDFVARVAEVVVPDELRAPDGGLDVPGAGRTPLGFTRTASGVFTTAELPTGVRLVGTNEWHRPPPEGPMTLDELRASVRRVLGADLPMRAPDGPGPHRLFRHTLVSRCADRYRAGHVLLIGDAAHIQFGIGGPGLNLGLQDAVNLGWKLAAEVRGTAPAGLLDTYDAEHRPVAGRVLMQTRAQVALLAADDEVTGLRELFAELLREPAALRHVAATMAGADVRYPPRVSTPAAHPLAGDWAPDLPVRLVPRPRPAPANAGAPGRQATAAAGDGAAHPDRDGVGAEAGCATRVAVLQRTGRPLLITLTESPEPTGPAARTAGGTPTAAADTAADVAGGVAVAVGAVAGGWADRVDLVDACPDGAPAPAAAMLIRPDGHVAWAADPADPPETVTAGLRAALTTWFGAPISA